MASIKKTITQLIGSFTSPQLIRSIFFDPFSKTVLLEPRCVGVGLLRSPALECLNRKSHHRITGRSHKEHRNPVGQVPRNNRPFHDHLPPDVPCKDLFAVQLNGVHAFAL